MAKFLLRNGMGEIRLKHTVVDTDRHGNVRVYFRKLGKKIRLIETPGTDAFFEEYKRAASGEIVAKVADVPRGPSDGTLAWLFLRYFESAEFKGLHDSTRHVRRLILEKIAEADGSKPYKLLETKHVRRMRDLKAEKPEAANSRVKALRAVFSWAISPGVELAETNPARDVPYIEAKGDGFHSWTDVEIAKYLTHHKEGSRARLALALLLNTGQRRSDIVLFGPKHVHQHDGEPWLHFTQQKDIDRNPVYLEIPMSEDLLSTMSSTALGDETFLLNAYGRPYTAESFSNWFRDCCDEAGLEHCSAHGLRKAAARRLAEAGCSAHEIMAITGHTTLKEVTRYTSAARQPKLAKRAFSKTAATTKNVPLFEGQNDGGTKGATKPLILLDQGKEVVPGTGIEPVTRGFSIRCSTN